MLQQLIKDSEAETAENFRICGRAAELVVRLLCMSCCTWARFCDQVDQPVEHKQRGAMGLLWVYENGFCFNWSPSSGSSMVCN